MEIVRNNDDINQLKENSVIGNIRIGENVEIRFEGIDNMIFISSPNTETLVANCKITFRRNSSIAYFIGSRIGNCRVTLYDGCWFCCGSGNYFNPSKGISVEISCDEGKGVLIGDNCMFSELVEMRTGDMHQIYDIASGSRVNHSRSIFVGDAVWLGNGVTLLKGTRIGSGAIVGAKSVTSGKRITSNSVWAGNPARQVKRDIMWVDGFSSAYEREEIQDHSFSDSLLHIFEEDDTPPIFDDLDDKLSRTKLTPTERAELFQNLPHLKNRFYVKNPV